MTDAQKAVWDRIWSADVSYQWDSLSQTVYEAIRRQFGTAVGKRIAEIGSGTGKISLRLSADGAEVTLVDYSDQAIANSRRAFRQAGQTGQFIHADARKLKELPDDCFDLTWNAGVLEHFTYDDQVTVLREMARVTKPGGMVLVLNPCASCLPYRIGKAFAENNGFWPYGVEVPIATLQQQFADSGIGQLEETNVGFGDGLAFLDFIPGMQSLKLWMNTWYSQLPESEKTLFAGYLLASRGTVGKQPEQRAGLERLHQAQEILSGYHQKRASSHYLAAYREAEASYWLPLLSTLDTLLAGGGKKVLDVGAAYGTLLLYSALAGAEGTGIDQMDSYWSPELERDYGIGWHRCNIEAEAIPGTDMYDVIVFTEVLEHMNYNPLPVLRKFRDRLAPQGSLLLSTPWKRAFAPHHAAPDVLEMPYCREGATFIDAEIKYYTIDELFVMAAATGFKVESLDLYNGHLLVHLV
ncbi:MAG: Methyltransferase type 11 [Paenibacillus sp.]|nr:Methyltransferase type 11 [Paenibacillus sp.]